MQPLRKRLPWVESGLIVAGLSFIMLGTMPDLTASERTAVDVIVFGITGWFCVEYLARWSVPALAHLRGRRRGWLSYSESAFSRVGLIDLMAAAPVPVALAVGAGPDTARLFGMLWVLRLVRRTTAFSLLFRVVRNERQHLVGVALTFFIILLLSATAAYVIERHSGNEGAFRSIPQALWWAIVTLTTTGYGDAVPSTGAGRVLSGLVMVYGIAIFALWAGILAMGFMNEVRRMDFLKTWELVARMPFFTGVHAGTIAELTRLLRPEDLPGNRVVIRKDEAADCMYFIATGEVEVQAERSVYLGSGAFFGEMALITASTRNATVVTTMPSTLLRLEVGDFWELAAKHGDLATSIGAEAERRALTNEPLREVLRAGSTA